MIEQQGYIDFSHVPQSKGITPIVQWVLYVGIVGIFIIGGFSAFLADEGNRHMWPSDTTMREPLGSMPSNLQ
jgi:hypothetical protein